MVYGIITLTGPLQHDKENTTYRKNKCGRITIHKLFFSTETTKEKKERESLKNAQPKKKNRYTKKEKKNAPSFTFTLEQSKNISLPNRPFHIPDNHPPRFIHELNADLCNTPTRTGTTEDFDDFGEFDGCFG